MFPNPYSDVGYVWPNRYMDSFLESHEVKVGIRIFNINMQFLTDASARLVSGQVDMDANAQVTRSGRVTLWDPFNDLSLGVGTEQQYNRIIEVKYWTRNLMSQQWWETTVATCVITDVSRDGGILEVEFKGKEILADHGLHTPYTWPQGWPKGDVITNAMYVFTGETSWWNQAPVQPLQWNWSIDAGENLWTRLKELARSNGCNLFYNGYGILRIKPLQVDTLFTITENMLTSRPSVDFDMDNFINMVRVEGVVVALTSDGAETRLVYEAWTPASDPSSAQALARNGIPRVFGKVIQDDQIADYISAAQLAISELQHSNIVTNNTSLTCKVLPFIEEWDIIWITHKSVQTVTATTKWTLPLVGDGEMSFNFMSNTSFAYTGQPDFAYNGAFVDMSPTITRPKQAMNKFGAPIRKHGPSGAQGSKHLPGGHDIDKLKGENWYGGKGKKGNKNGGQDKKGNKDKGKKGGKK